MPRVLVAEKDPGVAALLRDALSSWGYAIEGDDPELLLCGSVAALLEERARGAKAPALLLSGESADGLGVVGRLPKPFDLDELRWEMALRLDPPRATGRRSGRASGPPIRRHP